MRSKFVILTATALSFGFAQAASAADMPTKMPMKAPPMVAAPYNWTGFTAACMSVARLAAGMQL